jgi:uncharacterized protein
MNIQILWNHIGREHGGLSYTSDIRKNSTEVIQAALKLKEERMIRDSNPNQFIRYNQTTLIELPPKQINEEFIIIYDIERGLQFSLQYKQRYPWWLIDIVEVEEIKPNLYCVHDLFIDISVNKDGSYNVLDMEEFHEAIQLKILSQKQTQNSINSLQLALHMLNSGEFPPPLVKEIQQRYMLTKAP